MHDSIAALVRQEGWRAEGAAARVHYDGGGDRFAVEFYADAERVLYWTVPAEQGGGSETADADASTATATAAPVPRADIPDPLRRRIRADLADADIDPSIERREV
ncbi:DUF7538 family protein [Halorubrum sp. HHNYT27]|uniref:DUF7538 family protein n=1 Tax=Halorubrum sp. HHNYT27 TaxID=3402275 RepID=UPI003EC020AA